MDQISKYWINLSSEVIMLFILMFLLVTCFIRRKRKESIKALIYLIIANALLMLCQIVEWALMLNSSINYINNLPAFYNVKKIVYTLDYSLYFWVSLAFFQYIKAHINELYIRKKNENNMMIFRWSIFLVAWGIFITCLFAYLINNEWFYFIDNNGNEMFHPAIYLIMYVLGTFATLSSVLLIIRYCRLLGIVNFWLFIAYIVTPTLFVIFDLINGMCITYILMASFSFILYIHVDLREEELLREKEAQIIKQEKELNELNTQIMLSQMQPHFLYNTLSTISGLCYIDGANKAKQVVDKFSEYFRENLDAMGKEQYVSFEKELKHIQTYLWLEQIRFEDSLNIEYDINVSDFRVPSLAIQPIVENAVKHGIRGKKGGGTVRISSFEMDSEYVICVVDDGVGYTVGTVPDDGRSHTGLENISSRLSILCDGKVVINSEIDKGTSVEIHIPKGGKA